MSKATIKHARYPKFRSLAGSHAGEVCTFRRKLEEREIISKWIPVRFADGTAGAMLPEHLQLIPN